MTKQTPNPELFLIYIDPKDKAEVTQRLSPAGSLEELDENSRLTKEDKDAVRYRNAERFYALRRD